MLNQQRLPARREIGLVELPLKVGQQRHTVDECSDGGEVDAGRDTRKGRREEVARMATEEIDIADFLAVRTVVSAVRHALAMREVNRIGHTSFPQRYLSRRYCACSWVMASRSCARYGGRLHSNMGFISGFSSYGLCRRIDEVPSHSR